MDTAGTGPGPRGDTAGGTWLTLRLACREPFDGRSLLRFLAARAIAGVEEVAQGRYARTVRVPGGSGIVELVPPPAARGGEERPGGPGGPGRRGPGPAAGPAHRPARHRPGGVPVQAAFRPRRRPAGDRRRAGRRRGARAAGRGASRPAGARRVRRLRAGGARGDRPAGLGPGGQHPDGAAGRPPRHPAGRRRRAGRAAVGAVPPAGRPRRRRSGRPRAHHRPAGDAARAGGGVRGRAAEPGPRDRPGGDRRPARGAARRGPVDGGLHPDADRRPGRLPGQRSRAAPGHGAARHRARARRPVAALACLRRPPPLGGPGRASRRGRATGRWPSPGAGAPSVMPSADLAATGQE